MPINHRIAPSNISGYTVCIRYYVHNNIIAIRCTVSQLQVQNTSTYYVHVLTWTIMLYVSGYLQCTRIMYVHVLFFVDTCIKFVDLVN